MLRFTRTLAPAAFALLGLGVLTLTSTGAARAQTIVAPNAQQNVEGNNGLRFLDDARYQTVYAASQFSALTGPTLLTQIAFRPSIGAGTSPQTQTIADIQFDLSTTSAAPDALSSTFASNVGADNLSVFRGAFDISTANTGPAAGPRDFDIVLTFTTPFLYDPGAGNLLLDIRKFSTEQTFFFDAEDTPGDAVSNARNTTDVNAATANLNNTTGYVARFTFAPAPGGVVPEPGTLALAATGLLPLARAVVRKRRKA